MTDRKLLELLDSEVATIDVTDVASWKQGWVDLARYLDELPESQHHVVVAAAERLARALPLSDRGVVLPPNEITKFYPILKELTSRSGVMKLLRKGIEDGLTKAEIIELGTDPALL